MVVLFAVPLGTGLGVALGVTPKELGVWLMVSVLSQVPATAREWMREREAMRGSCDHDREIEVTRVTALERRGEKERPR